MRTALCNFFVCIFMYLLYLPLQEAIKTSDDSRRGRLGVQMRASAARLGGYLAAFVSCVHCLRALAKIICSLGEV